MVSLIEHEDFSVDRQGFFKSVKTLDEATKRATDADHDYQFIFKNRFLIEEEFRHLFAILEKNSKHRKEFWMYCYYCCTLLETYYSKEAYDKPDLAEEYADLCAKITDIINKKKKTKEDVSFPRFLLNKIATDLVSLVSTPLHTSKMKSSLGMTNMYRLLLLFSRISIKQSLFMAEELKWLDKLDHLFGGHIDLEGMVSNINAPNDLFNVLSVGLFVARLIINLGLILKHRFAPNDKETLVARAERFWHELFKRHYHLGNDTAWPLVNLLCNYGYLSAGAANWLTAGFLVFDVSMLVIDNYFAKQEYNLKKAQYIYDLNEYATLRDTPGISVDDRKTYQRQWDMLSEQLVQLDIQWQSTDAFFQFNIAAALLLMAGFTAPLILTASIAATVSYLLCTLAITMYLTGSDYRNYVKTSLIVQHLELSLVDAKNMTKELAAAKEARSEFIMGMVKSSTMPLLMVTVFAVCWEAALLLTVMYVGYNYFSDAWKKHKKNQLDEVPSDEEFEFDLPAP